MKCIVKNCNNENLSKASEMSFFKFPSNTSLLKKWISFCCRNENFNYKTSVICMDHFRAEDVENKLEYEMGFAKKRILRRDAVPTIKKQSEESEKLFRQREERIQKRENKRIVQMLIEEYETPLVLNEAEKEIKLEASEYVEANMNFGENENPSCSKKYYGEEEIDSLKKEFDIVRTDNLNFKRKNRLLQRELKELKKKMKEQSRTHEYNINALKAQLTKTGNELQKYILIIPVSDNNFKEQTKNSEN